MYTTCTEKTIDKVKKLGQVRIPILYRDGLYLVYFIHECDGKRFAEIFRDMWLSLPKEDRETISEFWDGYGRNPQNIRLTPYLKSSTLAKTNGPQMLFSTLVDVMPRKVIAHLVLHELGHVYLIATGKNLDPAKLYYHPKLGEIEGRLAGEIMVRYGFKRWGLNQDIIDKWIEENEELIRILKAVKEFEAGGYV